MLELLIEMKMQPKDITYVNLNSIFVFELMKANTKKSHDRHIHQSLKEVRLFGWTRFIFTNDFS